MDGGKTISNTHLPLVTVQQMATSCHCDRKCQMMYVYKISKTRHNYYIFRLLNISETIESAGVWPVIFNSTLFIPCRYQIRTSLIPKQFPHNVPHPPHCDMFPTYVETRAFSEWGNLTSRFYDNATTKMRAFNYSLKICNNC